MKNKTKKSFNLAFLTAFVLLFGCIAGCGFGGSGSHTAQAAQEVSPAETGAAEAVPAAQTALEWCRGKKLAVCSDSISTFLGAIPADYETWYPKPYLDDINLTWWMTLCRETGLELLMNASYSGSLVSGDPNGTTGFYFLDRRRLDQIGSKGTPDLILVMGGANDFCNYRELGEGERWDGTMERIEKMGPAWDYFFTALKNLYPDSRVIVMTALPIYDPEVPDGMPRTDISHDGITIADYNRVMVQMAALHGIPVIDTALAGLVEDDYGDGIHPVESGMTKVAATVIQQLSEMSAAGWE